MKIINWIKQNRLEFTILLLIIILAAFLRLYRIDDYMTFLGDEGRDAIIVKKILTQFDFPLIGPPTSIGNMYLGPLYYYMMSIAMLIAWLNPVSAAVMVAIIGVASVVLIYYLSREWFGKLAAVSSSLLYALSPVTIIYSRSSWNPNPAPFFALLGFVGLYLSRKTGDFKWFILTGVSAAFAVQMHYLALILLPVYIILWLNEFIILKSNKGIRKNFVFGSILSIVLFLVLMSPLVIFDLRHNLINFRAISTFFSQRETTVNLNMLNTLGRVVPIYQNNLIERYLTGSNLILIQMSSLILFVPLLIALYKRVAKKESSWPFLILGLWLVIGVLGLALYKQTIYDHYLGFLNPAPFILMGSLFSLTSLSKKVHHKTLISSLFFVLVISLILSNINRIPLKDRPNQQVKRTQEIARFVIKQSNNKPFNFALIAEHNYDAAYQYYLDLYGHKPKLLPFEKTEQLFVICEDQICKPVGHPKYEIAAFGWTKIADEKNFNSIKVFKLVHNPDQDKQEKE